MVANREGGLHCSESYCNLHDYLINVRGICLRRDALERSESMLYDLDKGGRHRSFSLADGAEGGSQRDDTDLEEHIKTIVRQEIRQAISERYPPSAPKTRQRKGGTPL